MKIWQDDGCIVVEWHEVVSVTEGNFIPDDFAMSGLRHTEITIETDGRGSLSSSHPDWIPLILGQLPSKANGPAS